MKTQSLLIGVFTLASVAFAAGKTYDVTISKASKAGSAELAPGEYQLKVEGATAVFTNRRRQSFTTPVKVESGAKKFQATAVDSSEEGSKDLIHFDNARWLDDEDRVRTGRAGELSYGRLPACRCGAGGGAGLDPQTLSDLKNQAGASHARFSLS